MLLASPLNHYDWGFASVGAAVLIYLALAAMSGSWLIDPDRKRRLRQAREEWERLHPEETDDRTDR